MGSSTKQADGNIGFDRAVGNHMAKSLALVTLLEGRAVAKVLYMHRLAEKGRVPLDKVVNIGVVGVNK